MNIRKDDNVKIIYGKDRGKQGKVLQVLPKNGRIVIDGLNVALKNVRARRENEKGQVVKYNAPMDLSNVQLVCPKCNKPTRVGHQVINKKKERVCKKCKQVIG
ncbi:50S ribosomal protein L24 [Patescibacteria group bacterium]